MVKHYVYLHSLHSCKRNCLCFYESLNKLTVECYEKEMFCNCSLIDFCSSNEFTWFVCPLLYEKLVKLYKESQMLEACGPIVVVNYRMTWHGGIVSINNYT